MKKRSIWELVVLALVVAVTLGILVGAYFVTAGVSARPQPDPLGTFIARTVRNLAIGWHAGHQANPVPNTEEAR
jgi:ABC-type transporter Mla maintaining outer membrane lipid asymmetry permease subunit MlaE